MTDPQERTDVHTGSLLGGRIHYKQFLRGYRTGIEPVLLAASIPACPGQTVLDAGCGAGAALLCLAARMERIRVIGLEADVATAALARLNVNGNQLSPHDFTIVTGCIPAFPKQLRAMTPTENGRFHHVMTNPPWHFSQGAVSPDPRRRLAMHTDHDGLERWLQALTQWVLPGGTLTVIMRSGTTDRACAILRASGCASIKLFPFWPHRGQAAKLVLVQATQGGRGEFMLLTGLTLHETGRKFTQEAENILRHGQAINL